MGFKLDDWTSKAYIKTPANARSPGVTIMKKNGFTLIELLVVIGIIFLLMALLFPALSVVEDKANRTKCLNNLKQIAVGAVSQFGELGDRMPYRGADDHAYGYAAKQLLPYVKNVKEVFKCPANEGNTDAAMLIEGTVYSDYEINSYMCAFGTDAKAARRQNGITDHSVAAYAYDHPYLPETSSSTAADISPHRGGANVAYLDGHAAFLRFEDMGTVGDGGNDGSEFFLKGHIFTDN